VNNGNAKAFVPKNIEDIIIPIKVCLTSFCDGTLPRIIDANCKRKIHDIKNKFFTESNSNLLIKLYNENTKQVYQCGFYNFI